jgi:hypothetical protein
MTEWMPAYKLFWDSVRRKNPYDPQRPFRWLDPLIWRINSGKQTTLMMLQERDRMNFDAQRLLDNKTYHKSYESIEAHMLIFGAENKNLRKLQPTLFVPRNFCATDVRISLERRILTDLALQNWW